MKFTSCKSDKYFIGLH